MKFLPIFLKVQSYSCLIIGGGHVAARKAELVMKAGGRVEVCAPEMDARFQHLAQQYEGLLTLTTMTVEADQLSAILEQRQLVVAATDNDELNAQIAGVCQQHSILCNVVDDGEAGSFIFPAIIDRDPVLAAVSSSGQAPVLTRLLRGRIEASVPAAFGLLGRLATRYRARVKQELPNISRRRAFWEKVLTGAVAELVFSGEQTQAETLLERQLQAAKADSREIGEVYLVGAGPGDPDLLTFKALRLMQQADIVFYDALVSQPILDLVKRDAELIHVGKRRSNHTLPQHDINRLLIEHALQGRRVLRLKGGDPFIFGRGGEEIEGLMEHQIPFQVVPGITAASGCASYSGIPLTHRDYSQSVRFITGHLKDGTLNLPWQEFVHANQTLVFYMGLNGLHIICQQLITHGRDAETPIALISKGTTPEQKVITGTLATMPAQLEQQIVHAPTLIIIGEVVRLRSRLGWDSMPDTE
ncbi:siroheme synthase CysG [Gynuella sunshinyii]|uniref:Siroheme synthase n=1 Tax=Gynuella sunshinyii YC6258 TaxID=1445510 RepID=A0A0C5VNC6_9GAMM|nr:siroheme synthase CysG [Gynuella sunshinyii]AJQ95791.1 uroporphyrinogen-III methylase [Gynuella sunshinyii YC6258]